MNNAVFGISVRELANRIELNRTTGNEKAMTWQGIRKMDRTTGHKMASAQRKRKGHARERQGHDMKLTMTFKGNEHVRKGQVQASKGKSMT